MQTAHGPCDIVRLGNLLPTGYECTGEFRRPKIDELYLTVHHDGSTLVKVCVSTSAWIPCIILRKLPEPYKPPTWAKSGCYFFKHWNTGWIYANAAPIEDLRGQICHGTCGVRDEYTYARMDLAIFPDFTPPPTDVYLIP